MSSISGGKRAKRPTNVGSALLQHAENEQLFHMIGKNNYSLVAGICQVLAANPDPTKWSVLQTGVVSLVKDYTKQAYFLRLYDFEMGMLWQQQLHKVHVGWDKDKGFSQGGGDGVSPSDDIDPGISDLLKMLGMGKENANDPSVDTTVNEFARRYGGIENLKREIIKEQRESKATFDQWPTPPRPTAPPRPPTAPQVPPSWNQQPQSQPAGHPSISGPIPTGQWSNYQQQSNSNSNASGAPPPPVRDASSGGGRGKAPAPPAPVGRPLPQPPSARPSRPPPPPAVNSPSHYPAPASSNIPAAPPPPPPAPMAGGPPAAPPPPPPPPGPAQLSGHAGGEQHGDARNNLLSVTPSTTSPPTSHRPPSNVTQDDEAAPSGGGIAAALMRALNERRVAMAATDDSDSSNGEDEANNDSEWSD